MENYLLNLNENQLKAVETKAQYVRVVAGAGSGKTRVLTTRIAYIIEKWGIDPKRILAITFTNKAANEMKERVNRMLNSETSKAHVSTIHSFCVTVLRQDIKHLNYPVNFLIMDSEDQKKVVKEAIKEVGLDAKSNNVNTCLDYIGNWKVAEISCDKAIEMSFSLFEKNMAQVYKYYCERQKSMYALDFDDLLLWTKRLFEKFDDIREKWQRKYDFILVDEFQDIDCVQYAIIKQLCRNDTFLYVVGDPDQTIYTWRGADINIIMNYAKDFRPCIDIVLDKNYRSTQNILNGANCLIKNNRNRLEKNLYTDNPLGSKIVHYGAPDEEKEAEFIVNKILTLSRLGYRFNQFAVLYRANYLSRSVEKALMNYRVPYFIYGGIRFYDRAEIKDILSYLRMLVNQDDLSFSRIVNVPKRGIGDTSINKILESARANNTSMFEASISGVVSIRATEILINLHNQIEDWKKRSEELSIEQTLQMLLDESGYRAMLENSEDPVDEERLENITSLIDDVKTFEEDNPEATVDEYLQMISLYTDIQSKKEEDHVSLLTIHAAKGLEFDNVFVCGLNDGVFPSEKSMTDLKGLEEERRLAYVAYTRAKENLFLTENRGYSFTTGSGKRKSRFINEINDEFLETNDPSPLSERKYSENIRWTIDENTVQDAPLIITNKPKRYRKGDIVEHGVFGEGVVLEANEKIIRVAFGQQYGVKNIATSFANMKKKEKDNGND